MCTSVVAAYGLRRICVIALAFNIANQRTATENSMSKRRDISMADLPKLTRKRHFIHTRTICRSRSRF